MKKKSTERIRVRTCTSSPNGTEHFVPDELTQGGTIQANPVEEIVSPVVFKEKQ